MTDQPYTPTTADIRNAVTRDESDWQEAGAHFDRWLAERDARIEAAAEQRGMRLAQEAISGDQTVERARHRVGDILSTAQVLHVIDQAIKNRADQEGAQGE